MATSPRCSHDCPDSPKCKCIVPSIQRLIDNNRVWRDRMKAKLPDYFQKMAVEQKPNYLWIGCSDSRVPAEEITGLTPGDMFVHRNVSNLVVCNDVSSLAVLQFAVEKLRVKDIIICGHYGCGGVQAAMENKHLGLLDNWLRNIRDVCRIHDAELAAIADDRARFDRLVELNIIEQCLNVFKVNLIQLQQTRYGYPRIHGLVYSIQTGELKVLDVDFQGYLQSFSGIYRLHSFPSDCLPSERWQLQHNLLRHFIEEHEETPGTISLRYIQRSMLSEPELYSKDEIEKCIKHAKENSDCNKSEPAFIPIDALLSFFSPPDTASMIKKPRHM